MHPPLLTLQPSSFLVTQRFILFNFLLFFLILFLLCNLFGFFNLFTLCILHLILCNLLLVLPLLILHFCILHVFFFLLFPPLPPYSLLFHYSFDPELSLVLTLSSSSS